jgi:hypothetical protein
MSSTRGDDRCPVPPQRRGFASIMRHLTSRRQGSEPSRSPTGPAPTAIEQIQRNEKRVIRIPPRHPEKRLRHRDLGAEEIDAAAELADGARVELKRGDLRHLGAWTIEHPRRYAPSGQSPGTNAVAR